MDGEEEGERMIEEAKREGMEIIRKAEAEVREMMEKAQMELKDDEKMEKFKKLRKDIVDALIHEDMEPYDAYMKFLHEVNAIYPDAVRYFGTDHFESKLRTYLLLWILKILATPQDF